MPRPSAGDVHVSGLLGNIAVNYAQKESNFISAQIFPTVSVEHKSDRYLTYLKEDWLRDEAEERVAGTESAGGNYEVDTTPNYTCRNYAFHKDIDDDTRYNSDKPMNADKDATRFITQKMLLKRERLWASAYMAPIWGTNLTGVSGVPGANQFKQWDAEGATILKNVEDWKELIASITGYEPNVMVVSPDVMPTLKTSSEIKDQIKYTQKGIVTTDLLAELFGVEKVLVPKGVVNTAAKGAKAAIGRIVSKKILLCYATAAPSLEEPSAGYNFAWTGRFGNSSIGTRVKKFRMENINSDRIEGEISIDFKQVAADMAVYAGQVVS